MRYIYLAAYVGSILIANLVLDRFVELPMFGLLSYGTIFFAFVFTLRDHLHRYGLKFALLGIGIAIVVNTLCSLWFEIPPRFLIASFLSILLSELADTAIFERLRGRTWPVKVLASNAVSVPLDSALFTMIAFLGVFEFSMMIEIIFADVIAKYLIATSVMGRALFKDWRKKPVNSDPQKLSVSA